MRIDFAIIGTQKGGTTAIHHFVSQHPDLFLPRRKELHFFDRDQLFRKWVPKNMLYSWYHSRFRGAARTQLKGETTPIYLYWRNAIVRMHAYNPAFKLIAILRDPTERAFSHYYMLQQRGQEPRTFDDAIRAEVAALGKGQPQRRNTYVDRGFYAQQIEFLLRYFDRSQLLILRTEDLWEQHQPTLDRVFEFLRVPAMPCGRRERIFSFSSGTMMSQQAREFLVEQYTPDVRRLERMFGWDLSAWLEARPARPRYQDAK